jgi:hypothetical protein
VLDLMVSGLGQREVALAAIKEAAEIPLALVTVGHLQRVRTPIEIHNIHLARMPWK